MLVDVMVRIIVNFALFNHLTIALDTHAAKSNGTLKKLLADAGITTANL